MDNLACAAVGTQVGIGVVATGCFDVGKPAEVACDFLAEHHTNPILAQPEWIDPRAKRRDRQSRHAQRSSVIWGVPPELSAIEAKLFLAHKKPDILRGSVVAWEGVGSGRHVEVRYPTRSRRSAAFDELATVCKELKWRATWARGYAHRSQLRNRPAAKGNGIPPTVNPFAPLAEGTTKEEAIAFLDRIKASVQPVPPPARLSSSSSSLLPSPSPQVPKATRPARRPGLRTGSLNIAGGFNEKVHELEQQCLARTLDVVAVQETRLGSNANVSVRGYALFRPPGEDASKGGGVATLVALYVASHVTTLEQSCEGQLWIQIGGSAGQQSVFVCNAYMPQASSKEPCDAAYAKLEENVIFFRQRGCVIVLGDLNARVGPGNGLPRVGPYTDTASNSSADRLSSLLTVGRLVSLGGLSKPPAAEFWHTRVGANGTKSMIDYILVDERFHNGAEFEVVYDHLESDHHLLVAEIKNVWQITKSTSKPKKRFRLEKFDPKHTDANGRSTAPEASEKFQALLSSLFEEWSPAQGESVNEVVTEFTGKLFEALEGSVGSSTRSKKFSRGFFDSEVREAIDTRRRAHSTFVATEPGSTEAREFWSRFVEARDNARQLVSEKKKHEFQRFVDQVTDSADASNMKLCWSLLERLKSRKAGRVPTPVLKADGSLAKSLPERLEAWADYQRRLAAPASDPAFNPLFKAAVEKRVASIAKECIAPAVYDPLMCPLDATQPHDSTCTCAPPTDANFTLPEVVAAVARAPRGKACGPDLTRNEMFKAGGRVLAGLLLKLFSFVNESEQVPSEWMKANVANLHKDGDACDPSNYRGISLISCLGKIYLSIWAERFTRHMESPPTPSPAAPEAGPSPSLPHPLRDSEGRIERMSEEQGGFRPGRSTIDQVFSLHEVLLRRRNGGESTFLYFVDFKKAFDTVWHDGLWHALHMSGIKGRPLKVLQSLYSDIRQSVLVDGQQTEYIRAHQGVRQGCPMSPVLFSIFIEQMVRRLKQASVGIKLDTQLMFALLYADDAVLLAESAEDLQNLINIVDEYCRDWRMLLNLDKSKAMVVPKQVKNKTAAEVIKNEIKQAVTVRGVEVPFVNEYKYLGVWIQQDLGWKLHIAHNVSKAKAKHAVIGPILRCGPIPAALKRLVWCAVVRSRLEYGAEVVTLNVELTKSLEGVQHMGVTTILRINRHASKQAANVIIGLPSISARFHQKRLAYLGKLLEMGPRRWPRRVYDLDPTFKVKLNGPRMRQWRTASLKLVKDARLEEHLGKPTWATEVRRWAKELDREAVLSAESNQRRLPGG